MANNSFISTFYLDADHVRSAAKNLDEHAQTLKEKSQTAKTDTTFGPNSVTPYESWQKHAKRLNTNLKSIADNLISHSEASQQIAQKIHTTASAAQEVDSTYADSISSSGNR